MFADKGFTLIELVIVISIISLIGAVTAPSIINYQEMQAFERFSNQLENEIKNLQITAITNNKEFKIDFKNQTKSIEVCEGINFTQCRNLFLYPSIVTSVTVDGHDNNNFFYINKYGDTVSVYEDPLDLNIDIFSKTKVRSIIINRYGGMKLNYNRVVDPPLEPNPNPIDQQKIKKKVLVLIYNPIINGRRFSEESGFQISDPRSFSFTFTDIMKDVTNGFVEYSIVETIEINDFPISNDGRKYNQKTFADCRSGRGECYPYSDYLKVISDGRACEKLNRGEIDEYWVWAGPYMGFYESNLAGPNDKVFWYNSEPTYNSTCNRLLPIMGFNYERDANMMIHNFIHRSESTFGEVFKNESKDVVWVSYLDRVTRVRDLRYSDKVNIWSRYGMSGANIDETRRDPLGIAGCGNAHWTPTSNNTVEYQYDEQRTVLSNCHEFQNFPFISFRPKNITCREWGCEEYGFYKYWFTSMPRRTGTSSISWQVRDSSGRIIDNVTRNIKNNWLRYLFDLSWR